MVMSPLGIGTKNDCADEDRQQFTRPDQRGPDECIRWGSRDRSLGVAIRLSAGIHGGQRNYSLLRSVHTVSGAHPSSYSKSGGGSNPPPPVKGIGP
jgi:hypothetical protein